MLKIQKSAELTGHAGAIYCLDHGRQSNTFFSGGADGFIAEWNIQTMAPEKFSIKLNSPVFSICHIPDKKLLLAGLFNGHLHVIDLKNRAELRNFDLKCGGVYAIHYNKIYDRIYTADGNGVFTVWNPDSFQVEISLPLVESKIREIQYNEELKLISLCCGNGELIFLEPEFYNETVRLKLHEGGINSVMLQHDKIYSVGKDAMLKITDFSSKKLVESIPAHNYGIYRIRAIDQNHFITCSRDKTIKLWDYNVLGQPLRLDFKNFKGHTHSVNDLLLMQSNNSIISCSDDKRIIVWTIA